MTRAVAWVERNSLALSGLALSLFSSGIDGEYMSSWMPQGLRWTGYALNTTADVAVLVLARWLGRLQSEDRRSQLRRSQLRLALSGEYIAIAFSWLFGWRQLRPIIAALELTTLAAGFGADPWLGVLEIELVALLTAGFVPVLNAYLGYAQALRDGVFADRSDARRAPVASSAPETLVTDATPEPVTAPLAPRSDPLPIDLDQWRALVASMNGDRSQ